MAQDMLSHSCVTYVFHENSFPTLPNVTSLTFVGGRVVVARATLARRGGRHGRGSFVIQTNRRLHLLVRLLAGMLNFLHAGIECLDWMLLSIFLLVLNL